MGFSKPAALPSIMVAPNGARKTTSDHPAIPVTIEQTAITAKACFDAGAGAIHFHVRDTDQKHVLDAGFYREGLEELNRVVPDMHLQITTEAVGIYSPDDMRAVTEAVMPPGVSIGIREMIPSRVVTATDIKFYTMLLEAGVRVQHICYAPEDVKLLSSLLTSAGLPRTDLWCLFTLGHYSGIPSHPDMIQPCLDVLASDDMQADWGVCAFNELEAVCLSEAVKAGGKLRVGFENSMLMKDGSLAPNNEARVAEAALLF